MPIKHADAKRKKALKILLFGDAGTGKTHLALNSTPGKVLIFDPDQGADFFEGRDGFDFDFWVDEDGYKTGTIKELKKAIRYLSTDDGRKNFDTFIIDPISDLWDEIQFQRGDFKDAMNSKKEEKKQRIPVNELDLESFNQKDWADMKRFYKDIMLDLKNLSQNVFLLAREKEYLEIKSDGNIVRTGTFTFEGEKNTKYAVDFVIRLLYDEGKNKRSAIILKSRAEALMIGKKVDNPTFALFNKVITSMGDKDVDKLNSKKENVFEGNYNLEYNLKITKNNIVDLAKKLGGQANPDVMNVVNKYGNPRNIKDLESAELFLEELIKIEKKDEHSDEKEGI